MKPETASVHGAAIPPIANRPAVHPIYQSAAYEFDSLEQAEAIFAGSLPGTQYGTRGAPNVLALEAVIRELEQAGDALVTNGGSSALLALFLATLQPRSHVVASRDLFGGTVALLAQLQRWEVATTYVDAADLRAAVNAIGPATKLVLVETISNPRMRVPNIPAFADIAHRTGAKLVVDNTLATPFHCRPLELGADVVVESVTKSLSGHFDVVMGAIAGDGAVIEPVRRIAHRGGMAPSGIDAWLATRGIASFAVRQERAGSNAHQVAEWLAAQPSVRVVHYPGDPAHADHGVAARLLTRGFGSMLSFELSERAIPMAQAFFDQLRIVRLVHSLGGPATTISHSATMTHRNLDEPMRRALGIHAGFLRLSVGLEAFEDIRDDLARGFAALDQP